MSSRLLAPLIAIGLGVGTGYYVFREFVASHELYPQSLILPPPEPLLVSYKE